MAQRKLPKGIMQRGDRFRWQVMVEGTRASGTEATVEDAVVAQQQAKARLLRGEGTATAAPVKAGTCWTLQQAVDYCLNKPEPAGWKGGKSYDQNVMQSKLVVRYFGPDCRLDDIDLADIEAWCEHLLEIERNSTSTVNKKLSCLSKVMKVARKYGGVERLPEFPDRYREAIHRHGEMTDEEERQVLALLRHLGKHDHAEAVECLLDLGCRPSELWCVTVQDVDFKTGLVFLYGADERGVKTGDMRSVPMTRRVREVLRRRCSGRQPGDRVFPDGSKVWLRSAWDRVRLMLGKAEDRRFGPYITRRTFITRRLRERVPIQHVSKWVGHRNITTTMRYAYLCPTDLLDLVGTVDRTNAERYMPEVAAAGA